MNQSLVVHNNTMPVPVAPMVPTRFTVLTRAGVTVSIDVGSLNKAADSIERLEQLGETQAAEVLADKAEVLHNTPIEFDCGVMVIDASSSATSAGVTQAVLANLSSVVDQTSVLREEIPVAVRFKSVFFGDVGEGVTIWPFLPINEIIARVMPKEDGGSGLYENPWGGLLAGMGLSPTGSFLREGSVLEPLPEAGGYLVLVTDRENQHPGYISAQEVIQSFPSNWRFRFLCQDGAQGSFSVLCRHEGDQVVVYHSTELVSKLQNLIPLPDPKVVMANWHQQQSPQPSAQAATSSMSLAVFEPVSMAVATGVYGATQDIREAVQAAMRSW